MSEAQKGCATLQDVDRETFIRFIRWAYTGQYSAAEFRQDQSPSESPEPTWKKKKKKNSVAVPEWDYTQPIYESCNKSKSEMKSLFIEHTYNVPATSLSDPPRSNLGPLEDYSDVFLSHARVYVFADKYDIEPLQKLALKYLHQTLVAFTLHPERCGDIIALIRYSYANTADRGVGVEGLRTLLTQYMGLEMATLAKDKGFKALLLENNGAVLGDFLTMVVERVN